MIPAGSVAVNFNVATEQVTSVQTGSIVAQAFGQTRAADFEIDPPNQVQLSALSLTPASVLGGRAIAGTINVSGPAPAGGVNVQIASDNQAVRPPSAVTVPFNQSSAKFTMETSPVTSPVTATVTATLGSTTVSQQVKLLPVLSLALDAATVSGGAMVNGSVTLGEPAATGTATITLSSSDVTAARVPALVTIAAGQSAGSFTVTTMQVATARTVTITATYLGVTQNVSLAVNPPSAIALSGFTISPDRVTGGTSSQGTVTLTGPAGFGGQRIDLRSSVPIAAQAPGFIVVPQGSTSAVFAITTTRVVAAQTVTITASLGSVSKTATLTVQ
jgi:hypothetical protein